MAKEPNCDEQIKLSDLDGDCSTLVKASLCFSLCRFITEVQKENGRDYPPNSLRGLLYMIQMHLQEHRIFWKLLDKNDDVFVDLAFVLDNVMKERVAKGMGVVKSSIPFAVQ